MHVKRLTLQQLRQILVLTSMLAWLGGQLSALIHPILVQHTRCEEHGEVVEVHAGDTDHSDDASVQSLDDEQHDHGCLLDGICTAALPTAVLPALPQTPAILLEPLLTAGGGARAPPLQYAPKTSPPTLC